MWEAFGLVFSTINISVFGYKVEKHWMSWPFNELVKLTMLWRTGPRLLVTYTPTYHHVTLRNFNRSTALERPVIDYNSYISIEIEAVKVMAKYCQWRHKVADVQSDCKESWLILKSSENLWLRVAQYYYRKVSHRLVWLLGRSGNRGRRSHLSLPLSSPDSEKVHYC